MSDSENVIDRILDRLIQLGPRYSAMAAFSRDNWDGRFISYSFGVDRVKDPDFEQKERAFFEKLESDPRPATWIDQNQPSEFIERFAENGIRILIRVDDERESFPQILAPPELVAPPYHLTIVEIDGPDNQRFHKLEAEIQAILLEEAAASRS